MPRWQNNADLGARSFETEFYLLGQSNLKSSRDTFEAMYFAPVNFDHYGIFVKPVLKINAHMFHGNCDV